jgi:glycosyltransferase involved in cell wall biosynthesis
MQISGEVELNTTSNIIRAYRGTYELTNKPSGFTGAEIEFEKYYNLTEKVAINALPDVDSLVKDLTHLIENPSEISAIGRRARTFIEEHHNYKNCAEDYLSKWNN